LMPGWTSWKGSCSSFIRYVQQSRHLFWIISINNTRATYACILFPLFVLTQPYHANPIFCKCFYNRKSNFLLHFDTTPI
jgi:hypothetical protein